MNLNELDLVRASRVYSVANTPLFLVRKLQEDPAVRATSERYAGEEIVATLREVIKAEPNTPEDAVLPYMLLVALAFKHTIEHLQRASELETEIFNWYSYIAQALLLSFSPIKQSTIEVQGSLSSPSLSTHSDATNSSNIIDADAA